MVNLSAGKGFIGEWWRIVGEWEQVVEERKNGMME